jgi:hypothetical protein
LVAVPVGVLVAPVEIVNVPSPVALWGKHPAPLPAWTVKEVVPGGVEPVVVIVRVEVWVVPVLVTDEGLNEALAPVGNAVVRVRGEVQESLFPLNVTVIV